MKQLLLFILISAYCITASGQNINDYREGAVSFISSKNVYVKFKSTKDIISGDTLYIEVNGKLSADLIVESLSSISCVCNYINDSNIKVNDKVYYKNLIINTEVKNIEDLKPVKDTVEQTDTQDSVNKGKSKNTEKISGKISVSALSASSKESSHDLLRLRYAFIIKADHFRNSRFSAESNISFSHKNNEWSEIRNNINNGLKIYSLAVLYEATPTTNIIVGRKYNRHISSIGPNDGLQIEREFGKFTVGAIVGSKPDHFDFGFNPDLIQFGGFVSHSDKKNNKLFQTSVALIEQKNKSHTDRRFLYFQHNNSVVKNLYAFTSFEVNLFKVTDNKPVNTFDLSSFYLQLRLNASKKLTLTTSFDKRNNIIYYETYKSYLDRLLEQQTTQGISFRLHYKLSKNVLFETQLNYRFRKEDPKSTKNVALNLSFKKTPIENMRFKIAYNYINTSYLKGSMSSIMLNYDFVPGKLSGDYQYRLFTGMYYFSEIHVIQHINELQLNWNINKKFTFGASYEAFFENKQLANRVYINLIRRF